jgi:hypothetical protein
MAYEQRDMSGSAFKNKYKKADNHPSYTGEMVIGGKKYKQAIWVKKDRNGNNWLSFSYQEMEIQNDDLDETNSESKATDIELDDEIPF